MPRTILLPLDLSQPKSWEHALPEALTMSEGGTLHILTVIPDFGMSIVGGYFEEGFLDRAMSEVGQKLSAWTNTNVPEDWDVHPHITHGRIYEEIIRVAGRVSADVIVIGHPRPNLAEYLLGPNAARVVRHASQSVYVVRGD